MRILSWLAKGALFLLLLGFAVKNTDSVTIRYFLGLELQAPLVLVLLITFAVGILAGMLTGFGRISRLRRELLALKRDQRSQPGIAAPLSVDAV